MQLDLPTSTVLLTAEDGTLRLFFRVKRECCLLEIFHTLDFPSPSC